MAKSKSQEKREAVMREANWQKNQQKTTGAKSPAPAKKNKEVVAIKMKTHYRDVAKVGDIYETDSAKADELVRLGRAEYVK
jgi:hypothetical protein